MAYKTAEAKVTRVEKTNAAGELAVTLDRDGWWILAVSGPETQVKRGERTLKRSVRGSLWVYVGR